jgi:hypothetical protein
LSAETDRLRDAWYESVAAANKAIDTLALVSTTEPDGSDITTAFARRVTRRQVTAEKAYQAYRRAKELEDAHE